MASANVVQPVKRLLSAVQELNTAIFHPSLVYAVLFGSEIEGFNASPFAAISEKLHDTAAELKKCQSHLVWFSSADVMNRLILFRG